MPTAASEDFARSVVAAAAYANSPPVLRLAVATPVPPVHSWLYSRLSGGFGLLEACWRPADRAEYRGCQAT
jgi:hypothetical protein